MGSLFRSPSPALPSPSLPTAAAAPPPAISAPAPAADIDEIERRKRLDAIAEMPADHVVAEATAVRDDLRGIMAMGIPPVPPLSIVEG